MAVEKNAIYKVHNGVDFDTINFKTIAGQVMMNDGTDLETTLANIIARGSNSNGRWVRFSDGTQICYATFTTESITTNLQQGIIYYNSKAYVFPASFIEVPAVSPGFSVTGIQWDNLANLTNIGVTIRVMSHENRTFAGNLTYIAIGRWK